MLHGILHANTWKDSMSQNQKAYIEIYGEKEETYFWISK